MVAANASLVLGYLWIGWVTNVHAGTAVSATRGALLPTLIALAIFGLRPACTRRQLPGASVALPVGATVVLVFSLIAVATDIHVLGLAAGATALLLGIASFGSVMLREADAGSTSTNRLHVSARGASASR
jgi:hypothetical protein